MTEALEYSPLQDAAAEAACLGACLIDAEASLLVDSALGPEDFYTDANRAVLGAVHALIEARRPVDRVTLYQELLRQESTRLVPSTLLLTLEESVPTAANVRHYIRLVREASIRRQVRRAALELTERAMDPDTDVAQAVADVTQELERRLSRVGEQRPGSRILAPLHVGQAIKAWAHEMDEGPPQRIRTPYPTLNSYLGGGFGPGEFIVLGGRRGTGKSAMGGEIGRAAAQDGRGVLVVSREMVTSALVRRIASQASRIPSSVLRSGLLTPAQWPVLSAEYGRLESLPLWFTDQAASLREIEGMVDRWRGSTPLGLLIVDYLQLVQAPAEIHERRLQVDAVSMGLKFLALRHHLPVLCLSSLRRPAEGTSGREPRPGLSDLRESGTIEHDADTVIFLHRQVMEVETELIIAKQRDGPTGTVQMIYTPEVLSFREAPDFPGGSE